MNKQSITQKAMLAAIRQMGMIARESDGEVRVNFPGGLEATAYYTNDRHDAILTARAMLDKRSEGMQKLQQTIYQPQPGSDGLMVIVRDESKPRGQRAVVKDRYFALDAAAAAEAYRAEMAAAHPGCKVTLTEYTKLI